MVSFGVFAAIFDEANRILLVRQGYGSRRWSTPGGRVEPGESPLQALKREAIEEIACDVRISHLIGVYARPYRDDLLLSFAATLSGGNPRACPPGISEVGFFSREELPSELAFNSRVRIEDGFEKRRGIVRVFESSTALAAGLP
ncbi:MAG TPA: NUDIX hydrolase [Candidatus Udaeobacter sp.]|jgi:ADP-ribose pyrophosphatase YjhB (NUDIX family)|nr:NUDIX hydrolase [Candidatus Udaeobacter sp.]